MGSISRSISNSIARSAAGRELGSVPVPAAPSFTIQPSNHSALDGANATFTSRASGVPTPTYQWYVDDGGGFDAVVGATNRILTLVEVTLAMDGFVYRCTATNSEGAANSSSVTLTVTAASTVGGYRSFLGWFFGGFGGGV